VSMNLIGITSPGIARAIVAAGGRLADVETRAVEAAGLAALLFWPANPSWRLLRRSRAAFESMVRAQRILEAAAAFGPLLPALPGTLIKDDAEARALLCGQRRLLAESLQLHGNTTQFQVTITWNPRAALAARRDHPDLIAAAAAAARGASEEAGQMIGRFMSDERARFEVAAMRALAVVAKDVIALPVDQEDMLANAAVLLAPGAEPDLERSLEAFDSSQPGENLIRVVGPLPPISFAAVSIDRPASDRVAAARRLLGVGEATVPHDLRRAYLEVARAHHPDTGARVAGAHTVGAAAEAFRLLGRIAEARLCGERDDVLLVDIVRQDEHRSPST
jgi:Gas vesicle synthesis protein GvpL/GvpF